MSLTGEIDPVYVAARSVLLDALEALGDHRGAIVLIGAQAIYLQTGEVELGIGLYTTDGDLAILPADLEPAPLLEELLHVAGFERDETNVGTWLGRGDVKVDFLVPEAFGPGGRRSADLGVHGKRAARRAHGIEAAAMDNAPMRIAALEPGDQRAFFIRVAGPGALLIAKLHKLADRVGSPRLKPKDALDVMRLLELPSRDVAARLQSLATNSVTRRVTVEALAILDELFGRPDSEGCGLAASALFGRRDEAIVRDSCAVLTEELMREFGE